VGVSVWSEKQENKKDENESTIMIPPSLTHGAEHVGLKTRRKIKNN
jgi:hypothetical protein